MASSPAARIERGSFGTTPDGAPVESFTLRNATGVAATILTYGGTIRRFMAPDRHGQLADVVLGYATLEEYLHGDAFFGAIIGRYANRIAHGRFTLDGVTHTLSRNEGHHCLHGGERGFDKRVWQVVAVRATDRDATLILRMVSPDGDMGFPGALTVHASYRLDDRGRLRIEFQARSDRRTVVNLTNHTYWNLDGEGAETIDGHVLTVFADRFTPVDRELIPSGEVRPVAGTALDFRRPVEIGERLREAGLDGAASGFDVNFVLRPKSGRRLARAAELYAPVSGRRLTVLTTEPGLQLYCGAHLASAGVDKDGLRYCARGGVALETQHFPDSPNQPSFPTTLVEPGRTLSTRTVWHLSTRASCDPEGSS